MRIICISDTHNQLSSIPIPAGDILIHAGDATDLGTMREIIKFNADLAKLTARFQKCIFVPGNHDWLFQKDPSLAKGLLTNATTLIDEELTFAGQSFYGSPWQPEFCNWAFNADKAKLRGVFSHIPSYTDILITHGPPLNIIDGLNGRALGSDVLDRKSVV